MKKQLLAICLLFTGASLLAQNPIPNNDFETWSGNTLTGWYALSVAGCTKSTQAHSGSSALKMAPWGTSFYGANAYTPSSGQGFPVNGLNPTALTGWYMANFANNDQMAVSITVYSGGTTTGNGYALINTSASSYTQFTVTVYNSGTTADSARIQFMQMTSAYSSSGLSSSTYVILDDLQFIGTVGIKEQSVEALHSWFNAATSTIEIRSGNEKYISASLYDLTGKKVLTDERIHVTNSASARIPATDLSPGIYLLRIEDGETVATSKILVQ